MSLFYKALGLGPTELLIEVVNQAGEPVGNFDAQLLLITWGGRPFEIDLPVKQNRIIVDLSPEVLEDYLARKVLSFETAVIHIEPRNTGDYAAISSDHFHWLEFDYLREQFSENPTARARKKDGKPVTIGFPRNSKVSIAEGQTIELRLALRKAGTRFLRLIDQFGQPANEIHTPVYRAWSNSNHWISGCHLLSLMMSPLETC